MQFYSPRSTISNSSGGDMTPSSSILYDETSLFSPRDSDAGFVSPRSVLSDASSLGSARLAWTDEVPDERVDTPRTPARDATKPRRSSSRRPQPRAEAEELVPKVVTVPARRRSRTDEVRLSVGGAASKEVDKPVEVEDSVLVLFSAVRHGRKREVKSLLAKDHAAVHERDAYGNTIFIVACQNGNKKMAKLALRHGADINAQNQRGNTGSHYAFAYGYSELGEYLLSKGASDTILNNLGLHCRQGVDKKA